MKSMHDFPLRYKFFLTKSNLQTFQRLVLFFFFPVKKDWRILALGKNMSCFVGGSLLYAYGIGIIRKIVWGIFFSGNDSKVSVSLD